MGSALLESLLAMLNMSVAISIIGATLYFSFVKTWAHFSLYEGLYCVAERQSQFWCERRTRKRIDRLIPLPERTKIQLKKSQENFIGKIKVPQTSDFSWRNSVTRHLFEYELRLKNPEQDYRDVK